MNSQQLCEKYQISDQQLSALVDQGMPRQKAGRSWEYDESQVWQWLESQDKDYPVEIIAKTVPECLRVMRELGSPISDRVFRTWMTEPGFPGRPGTAGKQDGYFPVRAIIAWAGGKSLGGRNLGLTDEGPKARLWETRARKEEIELAKLEKQIVDRRSVEAMLARYTAVLHTVADSIPDLVTAGLPQELRPRARADVEETLRKCFEVMSDMMLDDREQMEKEA